MPEENAHMRDQNARSAARAWIDDGAPAGELPAEIFRAFVDAMIQSVVWFDRDMRITYANASFLKDFDVTPEEAIGTSMLDLVPDDRREEMRGRIERAFELTPTNTTRTEEFRGEGSRWLSSVYTAFFTSDGELAVVSDLARDHTAQYNARIALETSNRRLAESNRDLQDFAYIASHDLQEPLRKISAFGDRLATKYEDALDDRGLDYLDRIRSASGRMQTLIDDVLTFSRVSTHGKPQQETEVRGVIDGVIDDLEVALTESEAVVDIGPMPILSVDASQLRQLFQNLIGNALKFSAPDVAPKIDITATAVRGPSDVPLTDQTDGWAIAIQDNGIGFDQKYEDKIFTVFQRLHNRTAYAGSGVGLAVCRRIVERHGGTLTAASTEGVGSTFTAWLPSQSRSLDEQAPAVD